MKYQYLLVSLTVTFCSPKTERVTKINFVGEEFSSPVGEMASLPYLIKGDDDNLYLSWVEKGDSNWVYFNYSVLNQEGWSEPELIAKGNDWFVNWADYPMIAVDKDGNMIAHYLAKSSAGTYSYDVNVVIKPATESNWSDPIVPHKDGTPTEHGFVTMLPQNDGTFLLSWLDGRNTGGGEHSNGEHENGGAMTIRTANINLKGELTNEIELDNRVCDCCQTGGTMTDSGPVIVYRDRSMEEIRDMSFVKKLNGQWTRSQSVAKDSWNIEGCPVNGPRVASINNQFVAAWFTAANEVPTVKVAFSNGDAFDEPIILDDNNPLGRVDIVMLDEQSVLVSWMTNLNDKVVVQARKVNKDGSSNAPFTIAEMDGSRNSGFPQMERLDEEIYFAWTHLQEGRSTVLMKKWKVD